MKVFLKILNIITWLFVIAAVLLAFALVGMRLIGFTPYYIESGSMEPTYHVYDLVYVRHIAPEQVAVGDPISFVLDDTLKVVTHRVVEIDAENGCFYTQGDANDFRDGNPVLFENYLGVVKFSIPKLGIISAFLGNRRGKLAAAAIVALLLLLHIIPEFFKPEKDKKKKSAPSEEKCAD